MDNEIRFWCAEQLTTLRIIPQPENNHVERMPLLFRRVENISVSGTWWQLGMEKMAIHLWEVATGENIHTFWETYLRRAIT